MRGIDISNWQAGFIPSETDIDFCICKATEDVYFVDSECDGFIQDCIANDILWGFYHFAGHDEPENEAQFFYDNCLNYFTHGIPVLDYEVTNYDNVDWCERFIQKLHDLSGVWPLLYTSASWCGQFENSWIPEKCGLWVAGYPYRMTEWTDSEMPYNTYPFNVVAIWQFTSSLFIDGFSYISNQYDEDGNYTEAMINTVDGDIAYMDREGWMKYANPNGSTENVENANSSESISTSDSSNAKHIKSYEDIAVEVLDGKWGDGWIREQALKGAGYDYDLVQQMVNALIYADSVDYNGC